MPRIPLSIFDLTEPLAEGGMGVVWRAEHRGTAAPVAIKVLTASGAERPKVVEALHAEVAAMAMLDHPNVVAVYDSGTVGRRAASLSADVLPAGSPWYAMELVEGGTLAERRWIPDWLALRRTMLALLAALAHAHAHGLVHRDLKPRNVLMGGTVDRPTVKLTDFGLAFARGKWLAQEGGAPGIAGTPTYLAPEQASGDPSLLGPWSDLYAAGCIAWSLACGRRPFRPNDVKGQVRAHVSAPIPTLRPRLWLPDDFEQWVYTMMAKRPADRFQSAAAAARALQLIDDGEPAPPPFVLPVEAPRAHLPGTGISLMPLRTPVLRGRDRQRAALGRALYELASTGGVQVVALRGPAGVGRTALGEWAWRRADETGHALPVRVTHTGSQLDGLPGALARALGLRADTDDAGWADRLRQRWPDDPGFEQDLPRVRALLEGAGLDGPQRLALAARTLDRLRGDRPVLLWVDDALLGIEALKLVAGLQRRRAFPTLVVLAVRDERSPEHPEQDALVRELTDQVIPLGPLADADLDDVTIGMVPLDPATRARLLARAGGNPGFLLELLRELGARGALRLGGASTFQLSGDIPLSSSLTELWQGRVERVLHDRERWSRPLFAAAALGLRVDTAEWTQVCTELGLRLPRDLVLALLRERLVVREPGSRLDDAFQFAHAMLREAVLAVAADRSELEEVHRACADGLGRLPGSWRERIGAHRMASGDRERALDDLIEGAWQRTFRGDLLGATMLSDDLEGWLDDDDPRLGQVLQTRVRAARLRGDDDETLLRLRRQIQWARTVDDPDSWVMALRQRAVVRMQQGDYDGAESDALAAVEATSASLGQRDRAQGLAWLALVRARGRRYDAAAEAFDQGDALDTAADIYLLPYGRGVMALDLGHPDQAIPYLRRALAGARERHDPMNAAQFALVLAQALRLTGHLDESTGLAAAALEQLEGWQTHWASEARVCLALCRLSAGNLVAADRLLQVEAVGTDDEAQTIARAALLAVRIEADLPADDIPPCESHGPTLSRAYELEVFELLRITMTRGAPLDPALLERVERTAAQLERRARLSPGSPGSA